MIKVSNKHFYEDVLLTIPILPLQKMETLPMQRFTGSFVF